jgi:EAL domain-containing protein (putative c-di-GMP-specific phosphodiesterase class I)
MTPDPIPTCHDRLPELSAAMAEASFLGVVSIDLSSLGEIEFRFGTGAFDEVRRRVIDTVVEQQGKDFRSSDLLGLNEPLGLGFLLFLDRKRRRKLPSTASDLRAVCARLRSTLVPTLSRAAFPYLKTPPRVDLGYGMAIHNPLVHPARIFSRCIRLAQDRAIQQRRAFELEELERIEDLIVAGRVVTAYQPILALRERTVLGFEALSRGARGSGLETADQLFGAASQHRLLVELDRLCRQRALLNSGRLPLNARLFLNTLPATIRDPQFRGKPLIDFLDEAQVAPQRIVIEITEKLVIDNYGLFREAMAYFTDLGMAFAVDDVGSGYSGLESIARLRPAFLKIDMSLVRDVHVSVVNREMVKAIVSLGHGIGAAVVAEGIQAEAEAQTLIEIGVDYGQGFYLARPDPGPEGT